MGITGITTASGVLSSRGILHALILLRLFIFAPILASAATYYVAPNGSNGNPGTQAAPFATLKKAHDVAFAGDTIFMRGGTYNLAVGGQNTLTKGGTSGNPIKVFNYPGEVPILDAGSMTIKYLVPIYMKSASWWHIKGLEIKSGPHVGLYMVGATSNNIIERCNIHHNGRLNSVGTGILLIDSGANNLFLNNDLHHNRDTTSGNADGLLVFSSGTGNVVRGNRVWRNSDDGIDLWNSRGVTVENNWSWENGYDDNLQPTGGNGNGFKLGGSAAGDGGHMIKNNLSWRNLYRGFDDNGANVAMFVYNNTAYENRPNFAFSQAVANVLKNNVAFGPKGVSLNGSVKQSFNSWNLPVTVNNSDFASLNFTCAGGPRQANGSLPNCSFLKLAAGSDLIDKGTNVSIAYSGSAPDLGAFEYGGTSVPPPPPPPPSPPPPATPATATPAWRRTIGETSILSVTDSNNGNKLVAQPATLSQTATIQSLSFYVTTASGNLRLGIYDATGPGGGPGAKKAETVSITPTTGWNTANVITPVPLPAGTYWLAYLASSNSLKFQAERTDGNSKLYLFSFGPMPATFSTAPGSSVWRWSLYATLTLGTSDTTLPAVSITAPTSGATVSGTAAPMVNFSASPTSGAASLAVTFTNSSSGDVTSYSWNFGDGSASTEQNPVHTYATAGTYSVTLTATGPGGTNTETGYIAVLSRPVAAYNFEEASGSKVIDASGQGNHGTRSGNSRITQGRFGKALSFDGLNDWVTVNDAASLDLTTGMTVEAWVYPTESMTGWRTLLTKESPPDRASYYLHA